ncbi:nucleotidyltransferase family protein [Flavobacterium sp. ZT3R18]|jgi:predicted nucleotidyltransferase|uniref:nucleotidyltransferase family protein n=1 Tax=Flavobacterium sp. ZT3R18 TaxID=2594429 RepID=UPI00117B87DD|nr:nucleotidyltransferase family protein [Flavobacterium sp. ZT3R18]TRX33467.1 nucleotidyltransferase family protein [Flavobacterium sp. ZT3R18]
MLNKQDIIQKIIDNRDSIKKFGVNEIGLFGSYVRNEQTENSDIDLLIDFEKDKKTLSNFLDFCYYMDDMFKEIKVDVVSKKGLSEFIGPYILKEVEYVEI